MLSIFADYYRLARAGFILSRYDALLPREYADALPWGLRMLGRLSRIGARGKDLRPGQRLARALGGQGPAYVKFGQFLATRPDVIGFEMAADLSELQDRMPPFPTVEARAELEKALGKKVEDLFESFSEPVAAASIAQVHKATLPGGRSVAVKILRPNIEKIAALEFRAFLRGAKTIEFLFPSLRRVEPTKFIQTLSDAAEIELDLRLEAGAASELRENLADASALYVPEIVWERSARRVLTIEWVDGIPVSNLEALDEAGIDRNKLATTLMQSFLSQALEQGFFHADMHQGNLLVDDKGRLVLIDFGIMGRLDSEARRVFAEIIYGFIQRDYQSAAQAHFDAGYIDPHHSVDAFATALRSVGEPIFGKDSSTVDMSVVLQQLFDVTEIFDMHLRPELVLLQRTMVVVEGVARALNPEINMWECAEPVVRAYIQSLLGPKAIGRDLTRSAKAALRLARKFPEFADAAERAVAMVEEDGFSLSQQTIFELARALKKGQK